MASNWEEFKQRLLTFCKNASPRELSMRVTAKALYLVLNGGADVRGGIASYHMLEDLKDMFLRVRDDEDRILAALVIASLTTGSRFKSLCSLVLELERRYGDGAG
ncbi:MAG: hypothetical protein L7G97_07015 [Acidilobus sp.]|nr:hypothetical protein [Acidilobus sp.]